MVGALHCANRHFGSLAQLVERHVYTVDVIGSIPVGPTNETPLFQVVVARSGGGFAALRPNWVAVSVVLSLQNDTYCYLLGELKLARRRRLLSEPLPNVSVMEHVVVRTTTNGLPTAVISKGREWAVAAEAVRWFERVSWWEARRRMPKGFSRVDVEVLQVQVRLGANANSAMATMLLERDGLGGGWRLRESVADVA